MNKKLSLLALSLLILLSISAQAQTKLGIKFGPNIAMNRIDNFADTVSHEKFGTGFRFMIGPILDIQLTNNYYVSTGIIFNSKRTGLRYVDVPNDVRLDNAPTLNYISIPATMKLYTNEIDLDKKLYLQFGGNIDILSGQPARRYELFQKAWFMDLSLLIAAGLEYNVGIDTRIFGGFSYQRGLFNVVREHQFNDQFRIWNDIISIELGVKF